MTEPLDKILDQVAESLVENGAILFIGSGASCAAGLPGWKKLLRSLSRYCKGLGKNVTTANQAIKENKFEEAAQFLFDEISQEERVAFFKNQTDFYEKKPVEIHTKILKLGVSRFITPNYDTLIEQAFNIISPNEPLEVVTNDLLRNLRKIQEPKTDKFIYKYHGCINSPENIILSSKEYRKLLHQNCAEKATLLNLVTSRAIVFIGAGLKDRDLIWIFDEINELYRNNDHKAYAFLTDVGDVDRKIIEDKGIKIIPYEHRKDDNHPELLNLLDSLYAKVSDLRNGSKAKLPEETLPETTKALPTVAIDRIQETERKLYEMVLSIFCWIGPMSSETLIKNVLILNSKSDKSVIQTMTETLIQESILRRNSNSRYIFPNDMELIENVGRNRIDDVEILLGGDGDE